MPQWEKKALGDLCDTISVTYHGNDDREHMLAINEYFYGVKHKIDGIILLPYSHQIYSIYMDTIIRDSNDITSELLYPELSGTFTFGSYHPALVEVLLKIIRNSYVGYRLHADSPNALEDKFFLVVVRDYRIGAVRKS